MIVRNRISLDGEWNFQLDASGKLAVDQIAEWRTATVPLPWQAQFADLRYASGVAWYKRTLVVTEQPSGAATLHFGAVDYQATVWLNGTLVGEHEGGYLPFDLDVTTQLQQGENVLVVRVVDATDNHGQFPDFPFAEVPHGKQSWYGPIGGLWQSVWLELRPALHLTNLRLTPNVAQSAIGVAAHCNQPLPANASIQVSVFATGDEKVGDATLDAAGNGLAPVANPALWSPDSPHLYTITATLLIANQPVDQLSATCGFRTVEARDGRIYLNGQPIYLRGVLDQAYYPETIYTPPSVEYLEDQVHKAKALGLNCLRIHIKIEDPRYYEVADRLGILIWTEIPNWVWLTPAADRRVKATFQAMLARDWNHPSIIAWTLVNENWGTDLNRNPEHRQWLRDFYHAARQLDPTRLIVDNSACRVNFHVAGDLDDYHEYRAIPDHAAEWDSWVADFAGRAPWAWAQDYLAERRADLPLVVSEFGNWGLPNPDEIQEQGRDPWWFENGHEWGDGIVYPHGMRERFTFWHLPKVFGSLANFTQAHQRHMAKSLHYELSTMRLHSPVAGYIITEFTDVHWECNGLLTMQRAVKAGLAELFTPLNQDQVVVIRPQRWSGRPGETLPVQLATFGVDGAATAGVIHWQAGQAQGEIAAPGGVVQVPLAAAGMVTVQATWLDAEGATLAHNQVEVACVAPLPVVARPLQVLNDPALAATLRGLGYNVTEEATGKHTLIVTRHYTSDLQAAVQQGARLLILAGPDFHKMENHVGLPLGSITARAGSGYQGDWATSFSWLNKQGQFAHLPGDALLEMEWAELMPNAVITGIPAWAMREHSYAGLALGWIHKPASLLVQMHYGRGALTVTTFNLSAQLLSQHAIAQALFAGLVALG